MTVDGLDGDSGDVALRMSWAPTPVRERLAEIQVGTTPGEDADLEQVELAALRVRRELDKEGLVLYAGTNVISPAVAGTHDPWLSARATCGLPGDPHKSAGFASMGDLEVLEVLTARAVATSMAATYADVRPQSATLANLAVFASLSPAGSTLASLPAQAGGHFSHRTHGAAGIRGHQVVDLPFDGERQDVDIEAMARVLDEHRPALVALGGSVQLFPYDFAAIARLAHDAGASLLCDISHPAGLVPGGAFPNPLDGGADAITFSTYKTYAGPPGGVIATRRNDLAERINTAVFPGLTANFDLGRLPPLHVAATELLRDGRRYGELCLATAKALAEALVESGLPVMAATRGYTKTNQVLIRMPDRTAADAAVLRYNAIGIYLSATEHTDELGQSSALRLGTQELVRRGMGVESMGELAVLLAATLHERQSPAELRGAVDALLQRVSPDLTGATPASELR